MDSRLVITLLVIFVTVVTIGLVNRNYHIKRDQAKLLNQEEHFR